MEPAKLVSGIRKSKRIPQTVSGFRVLFITEHAYEQLKARARILINSNAEFKGKDLTIVSGIHEQISKQLLTKSADVTILYFGNRTPIKFNIWSHWVERVYENTTHSMQHILEA